MTTDNDDPDKALANMKKEMAKKKPKLAVPAEFLDNAKSYDDKLTLVKILSEKNITSEHQVEAPSAQDAIDLVVDEAPFVISEVWCENIHDCL